jgi:hypothetical protein
MLSGKLRKAWQSMEQTMPLDEDQWRLERAKIAMEEYKMLHAEILQRNTLFYQVTAALGGGLIGNVIALATGNIKFQSALLIAVVIGLAIFLQYLVASPW